MKRIMLVLGLSMSCSIWAGEYFIIDVDDRFEERPGELCSMLVENFNRYSSEPPMVCVRKFHPDFNQISFPLWEPANIQTSMADIKRLLLEESANSDFFYTFEEVYQKKSVRVERSQFDFNSDGTLNTVFRITFPKYQFECDDDGGNQGTYEDALIIRYLVEQNRKKQDYNSGFRSINGRVSGEVFIYRNQPYFHTWWNGATIDSKEARAYKWPFPRIVISRGSPVYDFKESFYARPVCEIGYRVK